MKVTVTTAGGNANYLTFALEVGGRHVPVHVFWEASDLDDLLDMHRAWTALVDVSAEESEAIERWFRSTGLDRELPPTVMS
jgi:hypothetical protein